MAKLKAETEEVVKITPEQIKVIEKTIETQLAVVGVTDQQITKWEEEFKTLTISGIDDKDGYEKVYESRQKAKKTRILIKDVCEAGRAPLIAETKEWINRQKNYVARMESIEEYLQSQEDTIDAEKDRIKAEKAQLVLERYKRRVKTLTDLGATWDGSHYILDELSYSGETLRETEEDFFINKIVPQYQAINEAKAAIAKAKKDADDLAEKQRQEAQAEFDRQQEVLRQQQAELKKQQDALDQQKRDAEAATNRENARIEKEKQDAHTALVEKRSQQLLDLGFTYDFRIKMFSYKGELQTSRQVADEASDDNWDDFVKDTIPMIDSIKKRLKEEADAEQERLNKIAIDNANAERERQAEEKRKQELAEIEEGNDLDRWVYFVKSLPKEYPVMSSRQYKAMMEKAKSDIENIKTMKATRK